MEDKFNRILVLTKLIQRLAQWLAFTEWNADNKDPVVDTAASAMDELTKTSKDFRERTEEMEGYAKAVLNDLWRHPGVEETLTTVSFRGNVVEFAAELVAVVDTFNAVDREEFYRKLDQCQPTRPAQRLPDAEWEKLVEAGLDKIDFSNVHHLVARDMAETLRWSQALAVDQARRAERLLYDLIGRVLGEKVTPGYRMDKTPILLESCATQLGALRASHAVVREKDAEIKRLGNEVAEMDRQRADAEDENERSLRALRSVVEMLERKEASR